MKNHIATVLGLCVVPLLLLTMLLAYTLVYVLIHGLWW